MKWKTFDIRDLGEEAYQKWYACMSEEKQKRVDRFRFAEDKQRTVAGEMLARNMLAQCHAIPPESIVFALSEHGKPIAVGLDTHFNVSHSGNLVVCAVSDQPVGIDVERIRAHDPSLVARVCAEDEREWVSRSADPAGEFTRIWTAKEAYVKRVGIGLSGVEFKNIPSDKATQYKLGEYWVSICTA